MPFKLSFFLLLILFFTSCGAEKDNSFEEYSFDFLERNDNLVACAASQEFPATGSIVFFKTIEMTNQTKIWYSDRFTQNLEDYIEINEFPVELLFNDFMRKINLAFASGAIIVSVQKGDTIHYSRPIELLANSQITLRNTDIMVDQSNVLEPLFNWSESIIDPESIYFQLLVNLDENKAISGTYTYEDHFQFYDLSNVVFNVTEIIEPQLEAQNHYNLTLMHVSANNWVSMISTKPFDTF